MISQFFQSPSNSSGINIVSQSSKKTQEKMLFTPTSSSSTYLSNNTSFSDDNGDNIELIPDESDTDVTETLNQNLTTLNKCKRVEPNTIAQSDLKRMLSAPERKPSRKRKTSDDNLKEFKKSNSLKLIPPKEKRLGPPKKTVTSFKLLLNEKELTSLSNMEEINNFYEYTANCFQLIEKLSTITQINKCSPVSFPFEHLITSGKKRLAIFDLDETLVHCKAKDINTMQNVIEVTLPSRKKGKIGVNVRPNWQTALNKIKEKYIIVVYTASHQSYADAVLDFMDPSNKYFSHRLYRNNCTSVKYEGKEIYIKDLSIFKGVSLKDIVIIDNSVVSFAYHLYNGLPVLPYYDSENDKELLLLACYLEYIAQYKDLREANKKFVKIDEYKARAIEEEEQCFKAEKYVKRLEKKS